MINVEQLLNLSVRLAAPVILICLGGLFSIKVGVFNLALSGKQRRQVRVVEDAQSVWIQLSNAFQGKGETFRRLFWQTINQIDIR